MAFITLPLVFVTSFLILFGQLGRVNFGLISFPLIDISLIVVALLNVFINIKSKITPNRFFLIFQIFSTFSFLVGLFTHNFSLSSVFYFLRLTAITLLFAFPLKLKFNPYLIYAIVANVIFGLFQYFFWPDFTYFKSLNWDPHLYRLVSTYFDPTFTGLIYLFFLIWLYSRQFNYRAVSLTIVYLALALTYSRSTLIAFFLSFAYLFIKNHQPKRILVLILLVFSTIILLPRMPGEGTKLERSSSIIAKIENYRQGITLFQKSPFIGIGYNFLPQVRTDLPSDSHAVTGFDGSLLTLLICVGILGFVPLSIALFLYFRSATLFTQTTIIALLVHSLFANSLLYPFVISVFFFLPRYRK